MSPPQTHVDHTCFRGGQVGYYLYIFSFFLPWYIILEFCSRARHGHRAARFYFALQFYFFGALWFFYYVLRDHVFRHQAPYPSCANTRFSLPSLEMFLAGAALTMIWLHKLYFHAPYRGWLKPLLYIAAIWAIDVYTGNYTNVDVVVGLAIGAFSGACGALLMFTVILPQLPFLYEDWWLWWSAANGYRSRYEKARWPPAPKPADFLAAFVDAETLNHASNPFFSAADWSPSP